MGLNVLILGGRGQLGAALTSRLGSDAVPLGRDRFDIATGDPATLADYRPTHVVNCAAYNAVDAAETDAETAYRINQQASSALARWCRDAGIPLVHFSTDYVFSAGGVRDGDDAIPAAGWTEDHHPRPSSVYASTKFMGETLAQESGATVLRTCGLYGRGDENRNVTGGGGNFVETMLRLAADRDEVRVVDDQRCTPTSCDDLADWVAALLTTGSTGLFHATNAGHCTWAEFAAEIFRLSGLPTRVVPITTAEFGAAAARPANSVLDCTKLDRTLGLKRHHWRDALAAYLGSRKRN